MATEYIDSSSSDIAERSAKYRVAFRDTFSMRDALLEGVTGTLYDSNLSTKAAKFFDNLPASLVAFAVSQPVIGQEGSVFVIDIRLATQLPPLTLGAVMRKVAEYAPGCELIRVGRVSPTETSVQAVAARESFFREAAKLDQQLDQTTGVTGAVNNAASAAKAFSVATLAIIGVGAWLYLRK